MSLRRINNIVLRQNARLQSTFAKKLFATDSTESKNEVIDITTADEKPIYTLLAEDPQLQDEIARKRNKSRLNTEHRNILMGTRPYDASMSWHHNTVRYKKRMLGRYGLKGNDEPAGFAWPTLKEVKAIKEYEKIAFPLSLQERWKKLEEAKQRKAAEDKAREDDIIQKLAKMNQWTAELKAKIAKKEAELEAAKQRKERLVEEVRRHFGFQISHQDERFKAMLLQKEKEEKKKKKEAKKEARLEKLMQKKDKPKDASQGQTTNSTESVE